MLLAGKLRHGDVKERLESTLEECMVARKLLEALRNLAINQPQNHSALKAKMKQKEEAHSHLALARQQCHGCIGCIALAKKPPPSPFQAWGHLEKVGGREGARDTGGEGRREGGREERGRG